MSLTSLSKPPPKAPTGSATHCFAQSRFSLIATVKDNAVSKILHIEGLLSCLLYTLHLLWSFMTGRIIDHTHMDNGC
jgi:hypothetical protein